MLLWGYSLCVLWGVNVYYCGDIACVCFLQMAAQYSTRLYTPIHTSPKTIIVGISKKSYQTFLQRLISDMHMIIQYPQNTIPRIPKRPTTPVTHPYISPVYMHCESIQTDTNTHPHTHILKHNILIKSVGKKTRHVRKRSTLFWETGFFIVLAQIKQVSGVGGLASLAIKDYILQV